MCGPEKGKLIIIRFHVGIRLDRELLFFQTTYLILVNLQAAVGSKFYRLPPDKENTD